MAIQGGPFIIERTYGQISCYRVGDRGLIRQKNNLTRERWETDKAFEKSRACAGYLGIASKMASVFYNKLPEKIRKVNYFYQLTGLGNQLINAGFRIDQVEKVMERAFINLRQSLKKAGKKSRRKNKPIRKSNFPELYIPTAPVGIYKVLPQQPAPAHRISHRVKRRRGCRPSTPQRPAARLHKL